MDSLHSLARGAKQGGKPAWWPELPPESELKFSVMEGGAGWNAGGAAPGSEPPNAGKAAPRGEDGCLEGFTFCISGTLDSLQRDQCSDLVRRHGGRYTTGVSSKTDYLVVRARSTRLLRGSV